MIARTVLHWMLKRLPWLFQALAVLAVLGAVVAAYVQAQRNADRLLALRSAPPPSVAIQRYDPWTHQGLAREVRLIAQADLAGATRLRYRAGLSRAEAVVIPLLPTRPADVEQSAPLGFVFFQGPGGGLAAVPPATLLPDPIAEGHVGPIVELDGQPGAPRALRRAVAGAFGLAEDATPLILTPFPGGREAALSVPVKSGRFSALVAVALGCLIAAFALRRLVVDRLPKAPSSAAGSFRAERLHLHKEPATDRARSRFAPLAEQTELSEPDAAAPHGALRSSYRQRIRKQPVRPD